MILRISTESIPHRKEFNSANKQADETLKNWYDRLKLLAQPCDYGIHSEAFILNQFICGLDTLILEYLNGEQKDLSVNDVFDLTKSFDLVEIKQVLVSVKTEEPNFSDDEHYNDNTFNDYSDDDERVTANEVSKVCPQNEPTEENRVVPLMVKTAVKKRKARKVFECYLCHKTFKTTGKLTYHFTCCHSTEKAKSQSSVKRSVKPPLPSHELPKSYECYLCHKPLKTPGHLLYHFNLYHTYGKTSMCILCGKCVPDSSHMVRHLNVHFDVREFCCGICYVGFCHREALTNHLRNHSDPSAEKFECPKCTNVFFAKIPLIAHLKRHKLPQLSLSEKLDDLKNKMKEQMTQDGKYKCDICADQFIRESDLNVHSKVHNTTDCLCHLCGAKLANKRNLIVHYLVHSNKKPFQCDQCGRAFSTKAKYNLHIRTHTDPDASRPHKCTICGKSFTQKCHLAEHRKVHFPVTQRFKCDQCSKSFLKEAVLARHKLVHAGIKAWKCNYCEKTFKTNYVRVEHERTHTGEKPYSCPICGKFFAQQSSLRGHRKVHLKPPRPPKAPKPERTRGKRKQNKIRSIGSHVSTAVAGAYLGSD